MIEQIILEYLKDKLNMDDIYTETPQEPPSVFVRIEKTGGNRNAYLKRATVAIQSYGTSLYEAAQLNENVIETMLGIDELDSISKCELNSDYNFTDTQQKKYRYQAVFNLTYY
jgi:hypothetical protein